MACAGRWIFGLGVSPVQYGRIVELERSPDLDAATMRHLQVARERLGGQMWTKVCLSGAGIGPWPTTEALYLDPVMTTAPHPGRRARGTIRRGSIRPSNRVRPSVRWWPVATPIARGLLVLEVRIGEGGPGDWPDRRRHKRLDGLHVPGAGRDEIVDCRDVGSTALGELVENSAVAVLESKDTLNVDVIGQAVAGVDMFSRSFPRHSRLESWATVWGPANPALRWVAHRRGVNIHVAERPA